MAWATSPAGSWRRREEWRAGEPEAQAEELRMGKLRPKRGRFAYGGGAYD